MKILIGLFSFLTLALTVAIVGAATDLQNINRFAIDRSETTMGEFRDFVHAAGSRSRAEQQGGGGVYDSGWVFKSPAAPRGRMDRGGLHRASCGAACERLRVLAVTADSI